MTSRMLSVRLDEESDRLVREAEEQGRSVSDLVREALKSHLGRRRRKPPRPIDVIGDRIGCFDSGRDDLGERHSEIIRERLRAQHRRSR